MWGDGRVLQLDGGSGCVGKYTCQSHPAVSPKWVHVTARKLYFNNIGSLQSLTGQFQGLPDSKVGIVPLHSKPLD